MTPRRWIINFVNECRHTMTSLFIHKILSESVEEGCYLLGQTAFNPHTNELFYWVKVGQSRSPKGRFMSYRTDNPCIFYVDWLETAASWEVEMDYQSDLTMFKIGKHRDEWFQVSREHYLLICEKGFKGIEEIRNKTLKERVSLWKNN